MGTKKMRLTVENKLLHIVRMWPSVLRLQKARLMEMLPTVEVLQYSQRVLTTWDVCTQAEVATGTPG